MIWVECVHARLSETRMLPSTTTPAEQITRSAYAGETVRFGPFLEIAEAGHCVTALAARSDVFSARVVNE